MMSWLQRLWSAPTDLRVPYYHHQLPPDYFTGWRGWLILLINWFRHRVARYLEYRVMLYILARTGIQAEFIEAYKLRWRDEDAELRGYRAFGILGQLADGTTGFRYVEGRKNTPTAEEAAEEEMRKQRGSWARYQNTKPSHYTAGREDYLVQEVEADVVPPASE